MKLIKKETKERFPELRKEAYNEIKSIRQDYFNKKNDLEERLKKDKNQLKGIKQNVNSYNNQLENHQNYINNASRNWFSRLWNNKKIKNSKEKISEISDEISSERKQRNKYKDELQKDKSKLSKIENHPSYEKQKEVLGNFYNEAKEKWKNLDYTKEEVSRYFSNENLKSLSLDDYVFLLKRFPVHFATHVTRQGIRDHTGHTEHGTGRGKYHNNFIEILKDKKINSIKNSLMNKGDSKKNIRDILPEDDSKEEAVNFLREVCFESPYEPGKGSYADINAVHTATDDVADSYYGAERNNEIFFVFPSLNIASQYNFKGSLKDGTSDMHNDLWIWGKEGLDINTGVTFIPKNAEVNPKTGSKYKLNKNGEPVENKELENKIRKNYETLADIAWKEDHTILNRKKYPEKISELRKYLSNLGINNKKMKNFLLDEGGIGILKFGNSSEDDKEIKRVMEESRTQYKLAENTTSSKKYWENFFQQNPELKPNKIVYYEENDPNEALKNWKEKNDLEKSYRGDYALGFKENYINGESGKKIDSPELEKASLQGVKEFYKEARKAINESYRNQ